jgi:hypothetical protein
VSLCTQRELAKYEGQPFRFYGVRGRFGYLHAECWPAYELLHSTYDAQGRCVSRPMIDSQLWDVGRHVRKECCIHCNQPLSESPPTENPGN